MWVFEEILPCGEKLTDAINRTNENVKYLLGIKLGHNVVAGPDLENVAWIKYATVDSNRFTAMAISNIALADIDVPKSFLESFPKNVKGSLGDLIHWYICWKNIVKSIYGSDDTLQ
ncbi:putative glycerol-3-phosphate dehydrogenase (NAD(+)) [Helianthus annuus]|nr:putative glycerol-3-phosphate dehydrogenase (NAD(+)) [Helianthus annuus]KAJ0518963.1 putative glycerol-3-phosphate dehydrogenase (NAD(+)) [Helianthus annuus]